MSQRHIEFLALAAEARGHVTDLSRPAMPDDLIRAWKLAEQRARELPFQIKLARDRADLEAAEVASEAVLSALGVATTLAIGAIERAVSLVKVGACDSAHLAALELAFPKSPWRDLNNAHAATLALHALAGRESLSEAEAHLEKLAQLYPDDAQRLRASIARIEELKRFDSRRLGIAPVRVAPLETPEQKLAFYRKLETGPAKTAFREQHLADLIAAETGTPEHPAT